MPIIKAKLITITKKYEITLAQILYNTNTEQRNVNK